jgi:taurine dioxygenase
MAMTFGNSVAGDAEATIQLRSQTRPVGSLFEVIPSGQALGAEICNVDVRSFDDWAFAALMRALLKHQVLLVREQSLGEHELAGFSRRLGQASVLLSPATTYGAISSFSSLYAIYDALPPTLRRRIAHLRIRHLPSGADDLTWHRNVPNSVAINATVQPLVSIHPDTGRSMLNLGERRNALLHGMEPDESCALLNELWDFATRAEFTWRCTCRPGDLLIWDPRCTMRQRRTDNATHPRLLHRAEIWSSMSLS